MILQEIDNMPPVKRGKRGVSSAEDDDDDYRKRRDRNNECKNTSILTPHKLWISIPADDVNMRNTWLKLAGRPSHYMSHKPILFFCEDHFNLQSDMSNCTKLKIMESVKQIKLKPGCIPTKFDFSSQTSKGIDKRKPQKIAKRRRSSIIREIEDKIARNNEIINDGLPPEETIDNEDYDEEQKTDKAVQVSIQQECKSVQVRFLTKFRSKGIQTPCTSDSDLTAVKKSRFKSKQRTQETFTRVNKLKAENQMLEEKVKTLTKDLEFLKTLFMEYASKSDSKFEGIDLEKLLAETPEESAGRSSKS